jgi:voltage-gated potassium channel Kch
MWRDRLRALWEDLEWFLIGVAAAAALVLGYLGFRNQPVESGEPPSWLDHAYHSLQLWWLEYGSIAEPTSWQLDVARLLAPAVVLYVAGRAVLAIFREQFRLLRPTVKKRVVICGLGRQGWLLATAFQDRHHRVAVIERDEENSWIKACRDRGIPVVVGDATDPTRLRKARLHKARYLIAVCGKDGTNADVAVRAREFFEKLRGPRGELTVFAHVVDVELWRLLRERVVLAEAGRQSSFRLRLFNIFEIGARAWLREHPAFPETGDERDGRQHLLVVGVGKLGRSLVVGAATDWLARHPAAAERPRITIVDREALRKRDSIVLRHRELEEIVIPEEIDITWPRFEEGKFLFDSEGRCDVTRIYVCLDDDVRGVAAALALLERVREHGVRIVVRTTEASGLAGVVGRPASAGDDFDLLRPFPLLDRVCLPERLLGEMPADVHDRVEVRDGYVLDEPEAELAAVEGRDGDVEQR